MNAKSLKLGTFAIVCAASAAAAFVLQGAVPYLDKPAARYAAAFAASFAVLRLAARHVALRVSLKPQGLETLRGVAPRAARLVLLALAFCAPLLALQQGGMKKTQTLGAIIAREKSDIAPAAGTGYAAEDRSRLESIISKGAQGVD
jgi:hypothetical protein